MPVKAIDASALAALLFGAPEAEDVAAQPGAPRLVAPALPGFEVATICLVKARRPPDQAAALRATFRLRTRLGVAELAVDQDEGLAPAAATGLPACDASTLWLARRLGADLVTLDRRLARACA